MPKLSRSDSFPDMNMRMSGPIRLRKMVALGLATFGVLALLYSGAQTRKISPWPLSSTRDEAASESSRQVRTMQVSIVETRGRHTEVWLGVAEWLRAAAVDVNITIYNPKTVFDSAAFIDQIMPDPPAIKRMRDYGSSVHDDDLLVMTTADADFSWFAKINSTLSSKTHVLVTGHNENHDGFEKIIPDPLIQQMTRDQRLSWLSLSQHSSGYLRRKLEAIPGYLDITQYEQIYPIFPSNAAPEPELCRFAFPGDINYDRRNRDWTGLFEELDIFVTKHGEELKSVCDLRLDIIGKLAQEVIFPESLNDTIHVLGGRPYTDYYATISKSMAVVLAFVKSNLYYDRKSSSSIPAALIAGVPYLSTKPLIPLYPTISEEATYLNPEGSGQGDISYLLHQILRQGRAKSLEIMETKKAKVAEAYLTTQAYNNAAAERFARRACPSCFES